FSRGSYACYTPGLWTSLAGAEGEPVGNLFFAGEHCSSEFQAYMNGGAETGRKAAEAILDETLVPA
ncbi:MAG: FAD-dependent oxidoreductase, partial [Elusimicrobiota bacterium]